MGKGIARKILFGLLLTGAIMIVTTSPYFLQNIAKAYLKNKKYKNSDKRKIAQTFSYLKINQLIVLKEEGDKTFVDDSAAALILQSFLDKKNNNGII